MEHFGKIFEENCAIPRSLRSKECGWLVRYQEIIKSNKYEFIVMITFGERSSRRIALLPLSAMYRMLSTSTVIPTGLMRGKQIKESN